MRALFRKLVVAAAIVAAPLLAGCTKEKPVARVAAIDVTMLDTTCAACTDFFQYANGGWLKKATIPAAYPSYGADYEVFDRNNDILHTILDKSAADARNGKLPQGSEAWKVGAFYASCMDTTAIDALGAKPIKPLLDSVAAIASVAELPEAVAHFEITHGLAPFGNGAEQDPKDATTVIAYIGQGGLSLPERDYYFRTDAKSQETRDKFVAHVAAMMQLAGDSPEASMAAAKSVLSFETKLAKVSRAPEALRDPVANYHKMTVAEVQKLAPHIQWASYFEKRGATALQAVDVGQPEFLTALDAMLSNTSLEDWKAYLRWNALHGAAASLSTPFVVENFKFSQLFSGAKELTPRWKRCSGATDARLGELLGKEYVNDHFTPEAKARALKIVTNLVDELHSRLNTLEWMSAETKTQAIAKLNAITKKIGYPDTWRDYSKLEIADGQHYANTQAGNRFEVNRQWAKIGKPVDRAEWGMTPPTVNAYYNPQLNEIVFPAGILQPPFYNPDADDAVNYGAMGAIIGHEMTHGFDDQGRQYDKDGNLKDWWTREDAAKYVAEADKLVSQFNAYTVIDTATHVNGKLTLGENIADFGGITIAYAAMKRAIGTGSHDKIDGFTPEQRFFLGYAQAWRSMYRDEFLRMLTTADVHSPAKWRANGPLTNMPEFREAFGCKDTDAMVRPAALRPRIW